MKTIREIAEEIGVTKQAVHQKRKKEPLSTRLQPFTSTVDGVVYMSVDGEKIIKQAFSQDSVNKTVNEVYASVDGSFTPPFTVVDGVLEVLKEQLEVKDNQIKEQLNQLMEKEKQITELTIAIDNMTQTLKASQMLHAGTIQTQLVGVSSESSEKKESFFSKLFKNSRKKQNIGQNEE